MARLPAALRLAVGPTFVGAGVLHFVKPKMYEAIMPDYLPAHHELVLISGAAEIAGGVGALVPAVRRVSGWGLVALLAAVFPANLHMALHPDRFPKVPRWSLWARLPLQGLIMAWVYAATRD